MQRIKSLFFLSRPLNISFLLLAQVLCSYYILGLGWSPQIITVFFCTIFITAAGYIINDYFDVKADAINKPLKVYIGRSISRRYALLSVFILNITTLILAFTMGLNKKFVLTFVITIFLLWLYSYLLKRSFLAGNLLVAFLAGFSIYILSFFGKTNDLLLAFVFFAFLSNLIREIIKDCEDTRGDMLLNSKTIPIVWGINRTKWLIVVLLVILLVSIWNGFVIHNESRLTTSVGTISALIFYVMYILFTKKNQKYNFSLASQLIKVIILIGCLSIPLL